MPRPVDNTVVSELCDRIRRLEGTSSRGRQVLPFCVAEFDRRLPGGGLALGALHEVAVGGTGAIHGAAAALFFARASASIPVG
uniref:hypothetical protein n=1 Tax=Sinorhizobium chiapasense TaxID=501572 RepID=UPI002FE0656D